MKTPSFRKNLLPGTLKRHAKFWRHLKTPEDLAVLIRQPAHQLQLLSLKPEYREYRIPKKNGSFRQIEDPAPDLKQVLRHINHYLQAHYVSIRPAAVHGFCISPKRSPDCNILSNASVHLRQKHLLNVDIKDFFHQVSKAATQGIFQRNFPMMNADLRELLGRLTTRKGRLPMGAPTSPALSNYACMKMDHALEGLARNCGWRYSRFADDLSFSAQEPIGAFDENMIRDAIAQYGFALNEEKVKRFGPGEDKVVTGLFLREGKVHLPPHYLPQLEKEIARLKAVMLVEGRYQTGMSMRKLALLKQELTGKINFASMVLGGEAPQVIAREEQYAAALTAKEDYESANWLDIPYDSF